MNVVPYRTAAMRAADHAALDRIVNGTARYPAPVVTLYPGWLRIAVLGAGLVISWGLFAAACWEVL